MTNATQVSLALFADCADKQDRTFGANPFRLNCLRECDQRCETTAIIGDSRRKQSVLASDDREIRVTRKNRVEMRADDDQRRSRSSFDQSETIAFFVDLNFSQSKLSKTSRLRYSRPFLFAKRTRRDRTDANVFVGDCVSVCFEETERARDFSDDDEKMIE